MNEESIFAEARGIRDPSGRAAYLDRACAGDPSRRRRIEGLLRADDEPGPFLEPLCSGLAPALERMAGTVEPGGASTLGALGTPLPRVLLRGEGGDDSPVRPSSAEMPATAAAPSRLQLLGEIARGGMGAILKGRDPDLGRDLAVKVLLDRHRDRPELVARFVEEAQIAGQLQHPGIVPVYELGAFADRRPYFSMKLVKGRTLSEILSGRASPSRDAPRSLAIFEQVCQTVAYAHDRGVIHRDLKPSNVMVGAFGEVQVMDWGLAKVLPRGGADEDRKAGRHGEEGGETVISTGRSSSDSDPDLSQAGSAMGTPAYMAPEQARGDLGLIDERADVFALGSILCEVLTGLPAFTAPNAMEILSKARRGDLSDATARLAACGAEPELLSLARGCLAPEPSDRPRDAGEVAARITAHRAGVEERLRKAELARVEERARRRLTTTAAAAAVLLMATVSGGYAWHARQRSGRVERTGRLVGESLARASTLRGQARAADGDSSLWAEAAAAAEQAERLLEQAGADADPSARARVADLRDAVLREAAEARERALRLRADAELLAKLDDVRLGRAEVGPKPTDAAYAEAFRRVGLDIDAAEPKAAGAWIASRGRPVELAAFLDDWTMVRRAARRPSNEASRPGLVAREADPDPWRLALRSALDRDRDEARRILLGLADDPKASEAQAPASLVLLAVLLRDNLAENATAARVLRRACQRHPGDFWAHFELAHSENIAEAARATRPRTYGEEIKQLVAALAIRPRSGLVRLAIGNRMYDLKRDDDAISEYREAIRLRPDLHMTHSNLGLALMRRGAAGEAIAECREAIRLDPGSAGGHSSLGRVYMGQGKVEEAIVELREAVRLDPDHFDARNNLGAAYLTRNRPDEAIAELREALRIRPSEAAAHNNLGGALYAQGRIDAAIAELREAMRLDPEDGTFHAQLGDVLKGQGKTAGALAAYREAARLEPGRYDLRAHLGQALLDAGKPGAAAAEFREAIRIRPGDADACARLAEILARQGKPAEALEVYREIFRIRPGSAEEHLNVGFLLDAMGKPAGAAAEFREAARLDPKSPRPHALLGFVLDKVGTKAEAVAAWGESVRLDPDQPEIHYWIGRALTQQGKPAEAAAALRRARDLAKGDLALQSRIDAALLETQESRLADVIAGREAPKDNADRLGFADLCDGRGHHAIAARLYAEALEADPRLADDLAAAVRSKAAHAAALAGCGAGSDAPRPDEAARARLRDQARAWLGADLKAWRRVAMTVGAADRPKLAPALAHWQSDPDLIGVRDPEALAKLPDEERRAWQAFWSDVKALRSKVGP